MKSHNLIALSLIVATLSVPALAHDPNQHKKSDAAAADCSKMKDMDMSKMDANDPVMKAMQKKCSEQKKHDATEHEHEHESAKHAATPSKSGAGAQAATTADCSKMKGMDTSKMDMKDPAMKAMHDKCLQPAKHDEMKAMPHDSQKPTPTSGK